MIDMGGSIHAGNEGGALAARLGRSSLFRDYQLAFESATAMRLHLQPIDGTAVGPASRRAANVFCQLMAKAKPSCASCYALQGIRGAPGDAAASVSVSCQSGPCFAGLAESAAPIRAGGMMIARLETGQILLRRPEAEPFAKMMAGLREAGIAMDFKELEAAWFTGTVLAASQHESILRLLHVFAGNLSACATRLLQEP
jgi:hypothetical protein